MGGVIEALQVQRTGYPCRFSHFIRCIKPNPANRPDIYHRRNVVDQLRSGGVIEALPVAAEVPSALDLRRGLGGLRGQVSLPQGRAEVELPSVRLDLCQTCAETSKSRVHIPELSEWHLGVFETFIKRIKRGLTYRGLKLHKNLRKLLVKVEEIRDHKAEMDRRFAEHSEGLHSHMAERHEAAEERSKNLASLVLDLKESLEHEKHARQQERHAREAVESRLASLEARNVR